MKIKSEELIVSQAIPIIGYVAAFTGVSMLFLDIQWGLFIILSGILLHVSSLGGIAGEATYNAAEEKTLFKIFNAIDFKKEPLITLKRKGNLATYTIKVSKESLVFIKEGNINKERVFYRAK